MLQGHFIPRLNEQVGELTESSKLLLKALALEQRLPRHAHGRPRHKLSALAAAFLAKSICGFAAARRLIEQLKNNLQLRRCCCWRYASQVPHESCFSHAFAEFAKRQLGSTCTPP